MSEQLSGQNPNLALVAMHGPPEAMGLALRQSALCEPIEGWDIEVANQEAVDAGIRYIQHNLATSFPGDPMSDSYELRRAAELLKMAAGYRTILDIHDRATNTGEYALMGEFVSARLLGTAALLGIDKVMLHLHGDMIVNYNPRVLTVELCRGDIGVVERTARNMMRLRHCMNAITNEQIPKIDPRDFSYYERVMEISASLVEALGLSNADSLAPFESIPPNIIELLHQPPGRYVAEYWNGVNSSNGEWFGSVLRKIPTPSSLIVM